MATLNIRTQPLDRSDLARAFPDFRVMKAFENLTEDVATTLPDAIGGQSSAIAQAQATADAAQIDADAALIAANSAQTTASAAQAGVNALSLLLAPLHLVDAPTIAVNATDHWSFDVTLGGNRTLGAPTGLVDGARLEFAIRQDATGSRTLSFASIFDFGAAGAPVLSTTPSAADYVYGYYDLTKGKILAVFRRQDATASTVAYFSAHNNGVAQSIPNNAFTKLNFSTEAYDVGNKFASSAWTPPARLVTMTAAVCISGAAGAAVLVTIYKNGVEFKRGTQQQPQGGGNLVCAVTCQDVANGTDVYEAYAFQNSGAAQNTNALAPLTYFQGSTLTP